MASSRARRPLLPLLLLVLLLLAALASPHVRAASDSERRHGGATSIPPAAASGRALRQEFHSVAPAPVAAPPRTWGRPDAGMSKNGAVRRPFREWRRRARRGRGGGGGGGGGGTGTWTFSAMLPRGFVPPSGSSACHNDMPATAADAQFFACGGAGSP